jgi:hypothetical protein
MPKKRTTRELRIGAGHEHDDGQLELPTTPAARHGKQHRVLRVRLRVYYYYSEVTRSPGRGREEGFEQDGTTSGHSRRPRRRRLMTTSATSGCSMKPRRRRQRCTVQAGLRACDGAVRTPPVRTVQERHEASSESIPTLRNDFAWTSCLGSFIATATQPKVSLSCMMARKLLPQAL